MTASLHESIECPGLGRYYRQLVTRGGFLQRVCFILHIRPERLEEYKQRHKSVWPEMLDALRESGWTNYSLFLRADGTLIGYLETADFKRSLEAMAAHDVNTRWQTEMMPFFSAENGHFADQLMVPIEEVFHLESSDVLETTR